MAEAQPATIEGSDGFPVRNKNLNGEYFFYGELMAVATGRKPMAIALALRAIECYALNPGRGASSKV